MYLLSFAWEPYEFNGHLDGNGYVIKNLSVIREYTKEPTSIWSESVPVYMLGGSPLLINVKLTNATILVNSDDLLPFVVSFFGDACGIDCDVEGDIAVVVRNIGNYSFEPYIAGLSPGRGRLHCKVDS